MSKTYKDIDGWFNFENFYSQICSQYLKEGMKIIEIGVFKGKSICFLADYIKSHNLNIELFAVDHWERNQEYKEFINNTKECNVFNIINPIRLSSAKASLLFKDESLDFIFIDASHDYENVKNDINLWYPKLKIDGIIGGDDYVDCWRGVIKAVDEIFNDKVKKEFPIWWLKKK